MSAPAGWLTFPAWGSLATVASADPARLDAVREAVDEVLAAFDQTCSRFREDSELCAVNAGAGAPMAVSSLLLECVQAALRAAQLTDGDVDPTVGRALVALGYDRDFAALPRDPDAVRPVSIASVPGWRTLRLDPTASTITLPHGVSLDLGATAKALAADRAAELAARRAGCGVLVSLGGDLAIGGEAPPAGWRVRVTDDHRSGMEAPGQSMLLRSGGLATSSITTRHWATPGGPAHHLIDPSTGGSVAAVWRTASVAAASCLDANIASTAAIIRGPRAPGWLAQLRLPSRLVDVRGMVCHVAGWPSQGDDLPARESEAA